MWQKVGPHALLHIVTLGGSKRFIVAWFLRFLPTLCKAAQISILKNMLQLQHWLPCPALFIILGDSSVWHLPIGPEWLRMDWCFVWGGTVTLDQGMISGSFLVATGSGTGWRGGGRRGGGPRGGPGGGAEGGQRGGHFRSDQASRELPSCALHGGPELA